MAVKKRCVRCRKYVREDGTCQNPDCVLYIPDVEENEQEDHEDVKDKP